MATSFNPFHTGSGGFLLDRNGDGHPDDVAVRIVRPDDPAALDGSDWRALCDLAARLGLETTGLPERLVYASHEPLPAGAEPLTPTSAAESAALARAGLPETTARLSEPDLPPPIADLADLFGPAGLLRDRDGDLLPDGTRLALVLPEPCPPAIGIAAVELAARLGLESGGIDLPIAVASPADRPAGAVRLLIEAAIDELPPGTGRLRLGDDCLVAQGDAAGVAALLRFLATSWPFVSSDGGAEREVDRIVSALRWSTDPGETGTRPPTAGFAKVWEDRWEVDRIISYVDKELAALLTPVVDEGPVELLVLVSEPEPIRRALAARLQVMIDRSLPPGVSTRIRVFSAYKAGLCWLREAVIPALRARPGVDRIEIHYQSAPSSPEGAPPPLDLPIRWLQELFPGDELIAAALGLPLEAIIFVEAANNTAETYEALAYAGEEVVWRDALTPRWRRLPYLPLDPGRGSVVVSTGGVRLTRGGTVLGDHDIPTDAESFWTWFQGEVLPAVGEEILATTSGVLRAADQPFFARLDVEVWISEANERLGLREELFSPAEELQEDVYFGALDWLAAFGEAHGCPGLNAPGAIAPLIHVAPGEAPRARATLHPRERTGGPPNRARITGLSVGEPGLTALEAAVEPPDGVDPARVAAGLRRLDRSNAASAVSAIRVTATVAGGEQVTLRLPLPASDLAGVIAATEPPSDRSILFGDDLPPLLARLATRPGVRVAAVDHSYQHRPLWAIELVAPMPTARWSPAKLSLRKPTLVIVARRHANEVSSTTAALLLAERLTTDPAWTALREAVNIAILPFANPDGAALHQELVAEHPTWKHHAARYNAAGLEVAFHIWDEATPFGEARAQQTLWRRWLPDVLVDNHGIPSHEWTQHFAGHGSPPRFPASHWLPQALLYGIVDVIEGGDQEAFARELRRRLARAVATDPLLAEPNDVYGERYARWGAARVPARFPSDVEDGFLCWFTRSPANPDGRNSGLRHPATTTLDWVTEVPDETAHGDHLALTAHAHLIANEVTLRLLGEVAPPVERAAERRGDGGVTVRLRRRRPLSTI